MSDLSRPLPGSSPAADAPSPAVAPAPGAPARATTNGEPVVVVADGDGGQRGRLALWLIGQGWRVFQAGDGWEALRLVRREQPAMVVLDAYLAGLDGLAVCRAITRDPFLSGIKVVVVSSDSSLIER